jgi:hypothetical protein
MQGETVRTVRRSRASNSIKQVKEEDKTESDMQYGTQSKDV